MVVHTTYRRSQIHVGQKNGSNEKCGPRCFFFGKNTHSLGGILQLPPQSCRVSEFFFSSPEQSSTYCIQYVLCACFFFNKKTLFRVWLQKQLDTKIFFYLFLFLRSGTKYQKINSLWKLNLALSKLFPHKK